MTSTSTPHVAFIGLGAMGFAMSTHLVRTGFKVTGFDIFAPTLERFLTTCTAIRASENPNAQFSTATSPAEAVQSADIVLLMVANHHHVDAALFAVEGGAIATLPPDVPVCIMATIPPSVPLEVRARLDSDEFKRADVKLIDAPVSGGVARSLNGTLTIMAASDVPANLHLPAVDNVLSNLASRGHTLYRIPGTLGAGEFTKAQNQIPCGIHIVAGSEIMALAAVEGVNTTKFYQAAVAKISELDPNAGTETKTKMKTPHGWTWMLENRGPRMLDHSLPIASATSIINKDVGIIRDVVEANGFNLPLLDRAYGVLTACMTRGLASVDDAMITKYYLDPTLSTPRQGLVTELAGGAETGVEAGAGAGVEAGARAGVEAEAGVGAGVERNPNSNDDAERKKIELLLSAHAMINYVSAYETFMFGEGLGLNGREKREIWFEIVAGAAGGSTVFNEVIPVVFGHMPDHQKGFNEYARAVAAKWDVKGVEEMVERVKTDKTDKTAERGMEPVLLETALGQFKSMLG